MSSESPSTSPQPTAASPPSSSSLSSLSGSPSGEFAVPVSASGYIVYGEIGAGAFSTVYTAKIKDTGEEVAIKVIDLDLFNASWDEIRKEISTMTLLNHPNVTKIKGSFVEGQDLWMVMPLLQAGSCAAIMKQIAPKGLKDNALIATILRDVLLGLSYLHKDGRIHRDVKAGNILIGESGCVEISDFGVAGTLLENGDRKEKRQTFTGTPCWMAPEVMEQTGGYDEKCDIWSFGITAMEIAFGRAPYARYPPMKVLVLTIQEDPPTCEIYQDDSYKFDKSFESMIAKCLRKDPSKRPSAKKLLEHKFFKMGKDNEYIKQMIVKKLPPRPQLTEPIAIAKKVKEGSSRKSTGAVEVGVWNFDSEDLEQIKQATENKHHQTIEEGDDENDFIPPSPRNPMGHLLAHTPVNTQSLLDDFDPLASSTSHSATSSSSAATTSTSSSAADPNIFNSASSSTSQSTDSSSSASTSHVRTASAIQAGRFQVSDIVEEEPKAPLDLLSGKGTAASGTSTAAAGGADLDFLSGSSAPSKVGRFSVIDHS